MKLNVNYKKSAKLLILLLTSMLIATVSAATYRYMYIDGSITVGTAKIIWLTGSDAPAGTSIQGSTVTTNLPVENGTSLNFTNCLFLKNQDSVSHTMNLSITTAVAAADFNVAEIHIYSNSTGSWVIVDTLDMTILDTTTGHTLGAGNFYRLSFEIYAKTTASGTYNFDVKVDYV
jgi:hypothetical protein